VGQSSPWTPFDDIHIRADERPGRYLPYVGMVTIIMNDYPYLKYALIGLLGIFVLTSRE
jgi:hypothetical protein